MFPILFNYFQLTMFHSHILDEILQEVNTKEKVDSIMKFSKNIYDLHQFNIFSLYPKQVRRLKDSLDRRYLNNQIKILKTSWNQGQRRLFVWLLICFLYVKKVKPQSITDQDWQAISPLFHSKKPIFLDFQLKNIFKISKNKNRWIQQQDQILKISIEQLSKSQTIEKNFNNWNDVSKHIFFKTNRKIFKSPKACRQRWYNHLDKSKRKDDFTLQQDYTLIVNILRGERSWSKLVKAFNNSRTEHRIKNRYFSILKKYTKQINNQIRENEQNIQKKLTQFEILQLIKQKLQNSINIENNEDLNISQKQIYEENLQFLRKSNYEVQMKQNSKEQFSELKEDRHHYRKQICKQIKQQAFDDAQNQKSISNNCYDYATYNYKHVIQNDKYVLFPNAYFGQKNSSIPQQYESINANIGIIPTFPIYQYFYYPI